MAPYSMSVCTIRTPAMATLRASRSRQRAALAPDAAR